MLKWDTLEFQKTYKPIADIILGFVALAILYVICFFVYYVIRTKSGITGDFTAKEYSFFKWAAFIVFGMWVAYNLYDKDRYIYYKVEFNLDGESFGDIMLDGPYIFKYADRVQECNSNIMICNGKYFLYGTEPQCRIEYLWEYKQMKIFIENKFDAHMRAQRHAHTDYNKDLLKKKMLEQNLDKSLCGQITTEDFVTVLNNQSKEGNIH